MSATLQFASLDEFLDMGGYAFDVWSVYALFVLFFFVNLGYPVLRKRHILREHKRRLRRDGLINETASPDAPGATSAGETP